MDDTHWKRVVSKHTVGFGPFYDLQVPGVHSYLAEGVWNHNSGKTDACAHYVHEHVMGPPCLPGPVPHWIGIIAPTLGDAATSCYGGPSGLRVHSPEARMVTVQGGTVIRWPNGSEAKLFGAHSPEDVERLRSGGNRCAAEGTLVRTDRGEVPIERVRPGDRVWTRGGLREVLRVWDNGVKEVRRYDHAAGSTWLTPDHKVATGDGWKPASRIQPGDSVFTWCPERVRPGVLWPSRTGRAARVYDLTVDHDHEYFADGLLVSNCLSWLEELAAWRYLDDTWDQMRFGLRTGPRPHWVASTTPKPRELLRRLSAGQVGNVAVTRATTYDNPHLPEDIRQALEDAYGGVQIGRQELYAEIIDQDENALWNRAMLDATRVRAGEFPRLVRKSVGVDPSGGRGEQGIVVVGKALLPREHEDVRKRVELAHGFVIADRTCRLSPDGWGRRAVQAAVDHEADDVCVEVNFGGDMAVHTIRTAADAMGVNIPIRTVRATRGKRVRAEPVSALTEQGRWHLAGNFPELEDQLCSWYPELDWSPDRLDAMVWPGFHQRIVKATMAGTATSGGLAAVTRTIG